MNEKFSIYEILSLLVPGSLLLSLIAICFPGIATQARIADLPEAFSVIVLTALALFLGHVVQAVASIIEPVLERTWGGRLSEQCLQKGLGNRYVPTDSAQRIRAKLATVVGSAASDRSIFLYAMQQAEGAGSARVATFNAAYAYHRALFVLTVFGIGTLMTAVCRGSLKSWSWQGTLGLFIAGFGLLLLVWYRTKQRGMYYVREVLFTAERVLEERTGNPKATTNNHT